MLRSARIYARNGTLTHINNTNIHAEDFAGEFCNISHVVTEIADGDQPMPNSRPYGSPAHESSIKRDIVYHDNVVNRIIE